MDSDNNKRIDTCDEDEWSGTTTVANVVEKGKAIILGSDMQKTDITGLIKMRIENIIKVGNFAALTRAGDEKHSEYLVDKIVSYAKARKNKFIDLAMLVEDIYIEVSHDIQNGLLPANHRGSIIIGGYNRGYQEPMLFLINNAGVLNLMDTDIGYVNGNFQTGSGSGAAFAYSYGRYNRDANKEIGKALVEDTIYSAIRSDSTHSGEAIQVIVIQPWGAGEVETIEIHEYERSRNLGG